MLKLSEIPSDAFIRWDLDLKRTMRRGYSLDHFWGKPEAGISVLPVKWFKGPEYAVAFYGVKQISGTKCYVVKGNINGIDSDGCPTLKAESITILGKVSKPEKMKAFKTAVDWDRDFVMSCIASGEPEEIKEAYHD